MSVTIDKDFLLFRLRLVLFNAGDQKFVSLPENDEFSFISSSLQEHSQHSHHSNPVESYKRQESLNPFGPNSPSDILPRKTSMPTLVSNASSLVSRPTIRPKRFAGSYTAQDLKILENKSQIELVSNEGQEQLSCKEGEQLIQSQLQEQEQLQEEQLQKEQVQKEQLQVWTSTPFVKSSLSIDNHSTTFTRSKGRSVSEPLKPVQDMIPSININNQSDIQQENNQEISNSPILESYFASNEYIHPPLNKMLSTVGEVLEVESLQSDEQEEDEDLDEFRQSVVAARISQEDLKSIGVERESTCSQEGHESTDNQQSPLIQTTITTSNTLEEEFKKQVVATHLLLKEKRISALRIIKPTNVSALSQMVDSTLDLNNPFARDYSFFAGKSDANPLKLTIFLPFSEKSPSMIINVRRDANVQDVIGYSLFEYTDRELHPPIPSALYDTTLWSIRIVEDDGTIDEDFPALDRQRQIEKFGCDYFALCSSVTFEVALSAPNPSKPIMHTRNQSSLAGGLPNSIVDPSASNLESVPIVILKIHVYPDMDIQDPNTQITSTSANILTLQVPNQLIIRQVLNQACQKRGLDPNEFVLRMADTKTDVPMDKTVEKLKITEFSIVKRIKTKQIPQVSDQSSLRLPVKPFGLQQEPAFKEYSVQSRHLMGKYERILTIDGEYIRLASSSKNFLDIGKTASHHASSVVFCRHSKTKKRYLKLQVKLARTQDYKLYELEASSMEEAEEICKKIHLLKIKSDAPPSSPS